MPAALLARMPQGRAPPTHGYCKLKPIGKGAFGTVFLVKTPSGETAVLKEVTLKGLSPKERDAAMNEVRLLKKISHSNVVAYKDSYYHGDTLNIVMEYAAGGDLAGLIASKKCSQTRFSEVEVVTVMYQLTSALAYCHHGLKLLHRDLKPQNIFLRCAPAAHTHTYARRSSFLTLGHLEASTAFPNSKPPCSIPPVAAPTAKSSSATLASRRRSPRAPRSP